MHARVSELERRADAFGMRGRNRLVGYMGGGKWAAIAQRLVLAVVGGYFLSAAAAALLALGLSQIMPRSEAVILMAMCVFVIYLFVLLWVFAERRLQWLWAVLGGGAGTAQLLVFLTRCVLSET